jgi:DMSO/TMAO reductase YedYZ heme-binding membrane subunit
MAMLITNPVAACCRSTLVLGALAFSLMHLALYFLRKKSAEAQVQRIKKKD